MKKNTVWILVMGISTLLTACSNGEIKATDEGPATGGIELTDNLTPVSDGDKVPENLNEKDGAEGQTGNEPAVAVSGALQETGRNEAGLVTLSISDLSGIKLNSKVEALLSNRESYTNKDFQDGLILTSGTGAVLVTERYKEPVLGDIKIGEAIVRVKQLLGNSSYEVEDSFFYKTDDYYIGFKGQDSVRQMIAVNVPAKYDSQVLKKILEGLNEGDNEGLNAFLQKESRISDFFEKQGYINGGGYYANSYNGIEVVEFADDNSITVYNNFEGVLYSYPGENKGSFPLEFINKDQFAEYLITDFNQYLNTNERFEKEGALSPSGKYQFIYDWIYSMSQYFTIRTVDLTKPDYVLNANASEYVWLSDDYILYIHGWASIPYIIRISENSDTNINVLYHLGLLKEEDYGEAIGKYQYVIEEVTSKSITLFDNLNNKTLSIEFEFDSQNQIVLKQK